MQQQQQPTLIHLRGFHLRHGWLAASSRLTGTSAEVVRPVLCLLVSGFRYLWSVKSGPEGLSSVL